jgi:hypothetical protein
MLIISNLQCTIAWLWHTHFYPGKQFCIGYAYNTSNHG